jgi:hypothetical protein
MAWVSALKPPTPYPPPMAQRAVYTALLGRYEALAEQPVATGSDLPFICLTDDPELRSETWDVRLVTPALDMDPVRSARTLKITGHAELAAYDETLWIDARVRLRADPATILDSWLDGSDLTVARHSFRPDVVTEFEEVLIAGLDEPSRPYEQLTHYTTTAPALLEAQVPWTAVLARRRTPEVERAMAEWLLHVVRYSRRDQLSFVHATARAGVAARLVEIDNYRSELHEWLGVESRSGRRHIWAVSESLRPPVARIGELQIRLEETEKALTGTIRQRDAEIAELRREVRQLHRRLARRQARVQELKAERKA